MERNIGQRTMYNVGTPVVTAGKSLQEGTPCIDSEEHGKRHCHGQSFNLRLSITAMQQVGLIIEISESRIVLCIDCQNTGLLSIVYCQNCTEFAFCRTALFILIQTLRIHEKFLHTLQRNKLDYIYSKKFSM